MAACVAEKEAAQFYTMALEPLPILISRAMTHAERVAEWRYRYHERLGMLAGIEAPTAEQKAMARDEANQWLDSQINQ